MLGLFYSILTTSYVAWYIENHEHAAIYPFDPTYSSPADAGANRMAEAIVRTQDGENLIVWQAKADPAKPTILYLPGNAGTLAERAERFDSLLNKGYGLTAPAYRGSSGSTGSPEENHLIADAQYIASAVDGPLIIYGESLGAAVAIQLAAAGIGDAIVLEAPFTSLVELVGVQYPYENLEPLITQRWNSLGAVQNVTQPLLILHGQDDRLVPIAMGKAIFDAAASQEKTFVSIPNTNHTGVWAGDTIAAVCQFIDQHK